MNEHAQPDVGKESAEALHLLGVEAQTQGNYALAEDYYAQALAKKPEYAFSKLALAQLRMMRTGFHEGREEYEARFDAITEGSGPDWRGLPIARWRGESLTGKQVYIWAEQGLGDIVMFAGFLPHLIAEQPKRLVLGMFPKLVSLFARSFPGMRVEPIDDAANHALAPTMLESFPGIEKLAQQMTVPFSLEPLRVSYAYAREHGLFDVAVPMGDVLVYCMPQWVPAEHQGAYLIPDAERVKTMRKRLDELGQGRRIGISWHTQNTRELTRNVPLQEWLPLLKVPGCHFVSLQHGVAREEVEKFCTENNCRITIDHGVDCMQDAEGLAALIAAMDQVITIDNSNAHLAGALGVPTTLLLPKGHNYRWPEQEGGGTLWYKSVITLRQRELTRWNDVITQAAAQITET